MALDDDVNNLSDIFLSAVKNGWRWWYRCGYGPIMNLVSEEIQAA
jgi:hypothetical protein